MYIYIYMGLGVRDRVFGGGSSRGSRQRRPSDKKLGPAGTSFCCPTVALCLGTYGVPMGVGVSYERGSLV